MVAPSPPNAHFLGRVWCEGSRACIELYSFRFFQPTLELDLPENHRTIQDWWEESMHENLSCDPASFLPPGFEVCEEPVWFEAIGNYSATGWKDYWGEYDEEYEWRIDQWSVDFEEGQESGS